MLQILVNQRFVIHDTETMFLRPAQNDNFGFLEGQEAKFCQYSQPAGLKEDFVIINNKRNVKSIYFIGKRAWECLDKTIKIAVNKKIKEPKNGIKIRTVKKQMWKWDFWIWWGNDAAENGQHH